MTKGAFFHILVDFPCSVPSANHQKLNVIQKQESHRVYGTAVRGLVIHMNKIHLTLTLKVLNPSLTLTLTLTA